MNLRKALWRVSGGLAFLGGALFATLHASQPGFRVYQSLEPYDDVALPPDYQEKAEWIFARLMYPEHPNALFNSRRFHFGGSLDWREGGTSWTQDYPRADRHFALALRRLTRISARSVEEPVNLDDGDDVYDWPWLCAGEMGDWKLTNSQAKKLREYLLRGGFLMLDDFWGPEEWGRFMESMRLVFPDRPIVEIEDKDSIFHTVYDLDDRYQILGQWALHGRMTYRSDGTVAHWRGIYDDHGHIMVAMSFNSDIGDSWEWADDPRYPEKFSALGIRIGVNYVVYSMTH
jgi:glycine/D-amino acid oxidase-like deaminating enzyme